MKKLIIIVTSFIFTVLISANVFAAGDDANIKKLSGFKKTGTAAGEVIPQNTRMRKMLKITLFLKSICLRASRLNFLR